jgi:methylamine dehydrogenase accessory protein MauD
MVEALVISQAVLWIVVLVLAATVMALARQIGVLHERVAPMGALTIDQGPRVGDVAPVFELPALSGSMVRIGGTNTRGISTLLLFVSPTCSVCKKLIPIAKSVIAVARGIEMVFASDGDRREQERLIRENRLEDFGFVLSTELGMAYHIGRLPYAVLIDETGVVRAKGLVNTREHLESLLEAKRIGVASIQEYLGSHGGPKSAAAGNGQRGGDHG